MWSLLSPSGALPAHIYANEVRGGSRGRGGRQVGRTMGQEEEEEEEEEEERDEMEERRK